MFPEIHERAYERQHLQLSDNTRWVSDNNADNTSPAGSSRPGVEEATSCRSSYRDTRSIDDLNAEWQRLAEGDQSRVAGWGGDPSPPSRVARIWPMCWTRSAPTRTRCSAALVALVLDGDILAGRVVLQTMLGKVVRLAQAHPGVAVDDFVSALWCRIRSYPLTRRPRRIAANLAWDTRKDVLGGWPTRRLEVSAGSWSESTWEHVLHRRTDSELLDHNGFAACRDAGRVIATARVIGVIDQATAALLHTVYIDGASGQYAALRHHTTPAMVRYRCSWALRRMARSAAAIAEAA